MARTVQLEWTKPCQWNLERGGLPSLRSEQGIYQITRIFNGREHLVYIGIVWSDNRSFGRRMNEHRGAWLYRYRGVTYRFAHIKALKGLAIDRTLIEEVEGALIFDIKPPENTMKISSYSLRHDLMIVNTGFRGLVPRTVDTIKHPWR